MGISPEGLPAYAELHCLSSFSFLRGASQPEELVQRAAQLGYGALAITDECSVAGVVRAHVAAKDHGLIVGKGGLYGNVMRISPALTVTTEDADQAADILDKALGDAAKA